MLKISTNVTIAESEIEVTDTGAKGAGGQRINKVATAVCLRFDIMASSLPPFYKNRLMRLRDRRITRSGEIVIKSQRFRSREKNREEALLRLKEMIQGASVVPKKRIPTIPKAGARKKRLNRKIHRGRTKALRAKIDPKDQ